MLGTIGKQFALRGDYVASQRYDGGHINDTYIATYRDGDVLRRYVHQRINTRVFTDVAALNNNVSLVTRHIRAKFESLGIADVDRRVLTLVPTLDGSDLLATNEGEYWRTYTYIEGTVPRMRVRTCRDAFAAARAFGEFTAALADLPVHSLHETIAAFHDTPARLAALVRSIESDVRNRAASARAEIAAAMRFGPLARALFDVASAAKLPLRATHNDTKITNVLFDDRTGEGVCIVDLDTVMPGLTLFDVGELVRTAATRAAEDEPCERNVRIEPELFEAVARGFLAGSGNTCSAAECDAFVTAGKVLAFENAVRFLADYLNGDCYFRVHRPHHNLDRARAQLAIVASLEKQEEELRRRLRFAA